MDEQKYGLSIAYSVRARDARQVREVANHLLDTYFERGAAPYVDSVDTIPRSLLEDGAAEGDGHRPFSGSSTMFAPDAFAPLAFHVKYRDFHNFYKNHDTWKEAAQTLTELVSSDATPESFLAVLLVDALPLLQGA